MRRPFRHLTPAALSLALLPPAFLPAQQTIAGTPPDYARERAARASELTQPFSWFSLVALQYLRPGPTTVGSTPGNTLVLPAASPHLLTVEQAGGKVTLVAADPTVRLGQHPPRIPSRLAMDDDNQFLAAGTLQLRIIDRNGTQFLRVADANAPARLHFHGLRWYAPNPRFRLMARWIPYTTPHTLVTHNQIGQASTKAVPGYVEFTLDGSPHALVPLVADSASLFFVFRDATYLKDTDGGGRFLTTAPPSNGLDRPGTVLLDFNQAENPPCAYTPYATCPLASPENRLPIPIPAGEKVYAN